MGYVQDNTGLSVGKGVAVDRKSHSVHLVQWERGWGMEVPADEVDMAHIHGHVHLVGVSWGPD